MKRACKEKRVEGIDFWRGAALAVIFANHIPGIVLGAIAPRAYRLALAFSLVSALIVSDVFGLAPGLVDQAGRYLDWDKRDIGVVRIIDFVALAYVLHISKVIAFVAACLGLLHRIARAVEQFSLVPAAAVAE
jgi:hypothetical protein